LLAPLSPDYDRAKGVFPLRAKRRVGLALGGGGARGLAHLGVLIALEKANIKIDAIAGTSMGAVIGAAKAIGADLEKLRILLNLIDLNQLLQVTDSTLRELQRIIGRSMMEYVRGSTWREEGATPHDLARLNELFSLLTANKGFTDALIPFAAVAADVKTGERVVLSEGKLSRAITASTAVPGVFSPVLCDGRYLVDGGIVDKIPIEPVIELGADTVSAARHFSPLKPAPARTGGRAARRTPPRPQAGCGIDQDVRLRPERGGDPSRVRRR